MLKSTYSRKGVVVMDIDVKFSLADASKIRGIVDLCNEVFEEQTDYEEALKIFNEYRSDSNQIYIIGEYEGKVIAHTRIAIVPTIFKDMNTFAILNHVCVKPEFRKHHIATKMLEVVRDVCKNHECTAMKLWSRNFRVPAHTCYKKFGFQADDATFFSIDI